LINIERAPCPPLLKEATVDQTRFNHKEVVAVLWHMQHRKCCYCEMPIPDEGHLKAVEHFRPKSIFRNLKNAWSNLLLACAQCNGKKSDLFPVILSDEDGEAKVVCTKKKTSAPAALIDPSHTDPEAHLDYEFDVPMEDRTFGLIKAKDGSILGRTTIEVIGLTGSFYQSQRENRMLEVILAHHINLLRALKAGDEDRMRAGKDSFEQLMSARNKMAGLARAYARYKKLDDPPIFLTIPGCQPP